MGHWTIRFCFALCIGAIILAAATACGKHHGVSTSQLAASSTQTPAITSQDSSAQGDASLDAQGAWPSDQELIERYIAAKAAKLAAEIGGKASSLVTNPLGDEVKIENAWIEEIDGETCITFPYKNPGDYNLDRFVDLNDLDTLSQYYGQSVSEHPLARAADGNGDGVVNTADISVVVRYLYRRYGGASVYWSMTEDGEREELELYYVKGRYQDAQGQVVESLDLPRDRELGWFWIQPHFHELGEGPISEPLFCAPEDGAPHIKAVRPNSPTVEEDNLLHLYVDYSGAKPVIFTWDFGPHSQNYWVPELYSWAPEVAFNKPGPQRCVVTAENALGKDEYVFVVQVLPWSVFHPTIDNIKMLGALNPGEEVFFAAEGHIPSEAEYYWDFGGATTLGGSFEKSPTVTMGAPGKYYASVLVSSDYGYVIHHFVIDVAHGDSEVEPNNTPAQADRLPPANTFDEFILDASIGKQQASIDMADWFLISIPQGLKVKVKGSQGIILRVYDAHMNEVPESAGTSSYMRAVIFTARTSGSHYIEVVPEDSGVTTEYSLTLTNLEPSKYDDYESNREPPQTLQFPLEGFTGNLYLFRDDDNIWHFDTDDYYQFYAGIGQRLTLSIDNRTTVGNEAEMSISLRFRNENGTSIYSKDYTTVNQHAVITEVLPFAGFYRLQLHRFNSAYYDMDYELNGTLTYDNPVPYDILPHNATVNKPTVIYADIPGADGAAYYWEFSDGATPRVSSQNKPTVTFSKAGQYSGRVTITNGGTPSVTDFTVQVDEWNREYIATMIYDPDSYDVSLTADDFGSLHLFTSDDQYFKHDDTGWSKGPDLPQRLYIWGDTISSDESGQPVVIGRSGANLALYTLETAGWTYLLPGDPPIETESYYHYYPKLSKSLNGRFGAICKGKGINENGYPDMVLIGAWQTDTGWEVEQLSGFYEYETIPNIGMSPDGTPYICYKPLYTQNETGVLFHLMHWEGAGWIDEAVPAIDPPEGYSYTRTVGIYFDFYGEPHLVFNVSGNGEIREMWKNAGEWTCETALPANGYEWQTNWSLTQDSQRQPWMLVTSFKDSSDWVGDLYVVHKDGSRWRSETILSRAWLHNLAGLALDNVDKPHVVYSEYSQDALTHIWKN